MLFALLTLLAAAPPIDHVTTEVEASVSAGLDRVHVVVRSRYAPASPLDRVTIVLAADRLKVVPANLKASTERELFPGKIELGGFDGVRVAIDDRPCVPEVKVEPDGARALSCALDRVRGAGEVIAVEMEAELVVPDRYGPLALHDGQLTLAGGWYPYVSRPDGPPPRGPHHVKVELPAASGAVLGRTYVAPSGERTKPRRTIESSLADVAQVPLVVLAPSAGATPAAEDARALFVSSAAWRIRDPAERTAREAQVIWAATDALRFLADAGLPLPPRAEPIVVVEAPLRHELARATEGPVLVSDRAFRIVPVERAFRFHRLPVVREVLTTWALRELSKRLPEGAEGRALLHFSADAVGAWLLDRYVASRLGAAENAFDVLSVLSFIPAIDTMLYAPDLPFVEAYFRVISEADPFAPNVVDHPSRLPRGKVIYEKLLDLVGAAKTSEIFGAVLAGEPLERAVTKALGADAPRFLATWIAPYPSVRYRLAAHGDRPAPSGACGSSTNGEGAVGCRLAEITIARDGAPVAEPIEVRLRDEDGGERFVRAAATSSVTRTLTATLAAPLALVELDPRGRLAETPTEDDPSPRFDNRSSSRWKLLLNNFNLQLLASEQAVNTALDVGIARAYDVDRAYALRLDYSPSAIAFSGRSTWSFGERVTPARLARWIGLNVEGAYLRPGFGRGAEGCGGALDDSRAFALSTALSFGYDDRPTVWAPDAGRALRAVVEYNHTFGDLGECRDGVVRDVSSDALSFSLRGLSAWRIGGAHQLSVRGKLGAYVVGSPREQLLFKLGGRVNVRGYRSDARQGRFQGIASAEWLHTLFGELDEDFVHFTWVQGLDGALYADVAIVADELDGITHGPAAADVGYGLRLYIDYFGVRPGVMAIDVAFPLVDLEGRAGLGSPAVYIDFAQSFFVF